MVLGEAAAFTAAGAHALFGYNRENYMYDRKQRQEMEFKVLEWRATQAELWRDDVREVIGLTERKMDTYLIVNTLQLGMCVGLFSEGRLEPGTPPWLLHLYMLTLSAAFMYLLMSVWLAMHASIVASCSSVRLLTQFVRLPIPTWHQLEEMRTYAQTVEALEPQQLLRVPFMGRRNSAPSVVEAARERSRKEGSPQKDEADPWGLELHGDLRGLYELSEQPAQLRRHIRLAQRAAKQYQCFDAFARVAMSFGTIQLVNAISYYVLGYVAVQDGAPFPAICVVVIMMGIALGLVHLDFSLTVKEQHLAKLLIVTGPLTAGVATFIWAFRAPGSESVVMSLLPFTYAAHGLWLFFALTTCGLQLQDNGSVLPTRFRAVLYLDVFGWLPKNRQKDPETEATVDASGLPRLPQSLLSQAGGLCREPTLVSPEKVAADAEEETVDTRPRVKFAPEGAESKGSASTSAETEELSALDASPQTTTPLLMENPPRLPSAAVPPLPGGASSSGPSGECREVPDHAFTPASYSHHEAESGLEDRRVEVVTGHDKIDPGRLPAKVFRLATTMLMVLWAIGLALPVGIFREFMTQPLTADVFVEEIAGVGEGGAKRGDGKRPRTAEHPRIRGGRVGKEAADLRAWESIPGLAEGEVLKAEWPSHSGFVPHSLSCDPTGRFLVVADDLGVYSGRLAWSAAKEKEDHSPSTDVAVAARTLLDTPAEKGLVASGGKAPKQVLGVEFERLAPCNALEGQALKDVSVVCTGPPLEQTCRVVVLHAHGRRLAQCPLPLDEDRGEAKGNHSLVDKKPAFKSLVSWKITSDWLHGSWSKNREHVESFAVNSACLDSDDVAPSREVGCVVVGTTSGRIVQLRGAYKDRSLLIPERSMQQRERTVSRGSLHVFGNGLVVALRRSSGTLEAFNGELGTRVGEWRLPSGLHWLMLCGGGDSLFVLGVRDNRHKELHRFPLPEELKVGPVQSLTDASRTLALAGRMQEV